MIDVDSMNSRDNDKNAGGISADGGGSGGGDKQGGGGSGGFTFGPFSAGGSGGGDEKSKGKRKMTTQALSDAADSAVVRNDHGVVTVNVTNSGRSFGVYIDTNVFKRCIDKHLRSEEGWKKKREIVHQKKRYQAFCILQTHTPYELALLSSEEAL